jgi:protein-L-isoaspartate(D-aspartate) O-methyltransferase
LLIDQLKAGGKLVAPVGQSFDQMLLVIDKMPDGKTRRRNVFPVMFVPMIPARN